MWKCYFVLIASGLCVFGQLGSSICFACFDYFEFHFNVGCYMDIVKRERGIFFLF